MRHHFTNSERLALAVYEVLRKGGLITTDLTDMESFPITPAEPRHIEGWGHAEKVMERVITLKTPSPFPSSTSNSIETRVTLLGWECNPEAPRPNVAWRLQKVEQIFEESPRHRRETREIYVPTFEQIRREIDAARREIKHCEALDRLRRLMKNSVLAEPEDS